MNKAADLLFSVVVLHYKQPQTWRITLDSVLKQRYAAIEIVFADDGTPGFLAREVEDYIGQNQRGNVKNVAVLSSDANAGTVQNLRRAHLSCGGEYLTHIAADDAYYDDAVLNHYAGALEDMPADGLGVYGMSLLCDEELRETGAGYFDPEQARLMNRQDAAGQFQALGFKCCIPMAATAFRTKAFLKTGDFDQRYKLLEDWPFFLRETRNGNKFYFYDFAAVKYRAGGLSRSSEASPATIQCYKEHLLLYENEVFPYIGAWELQKQVSLYYQYNQDRSDIKAAVGAIETNSRFRILWKNKELAAKLLKNKMFSAKKALLTFALWIIGCLILALLRRPLAQTGYWTIVVLALWGLGKILGALISYIRHLFSKTRY